jgi:hypothetical protein
MLNHAHPRPLIKQPAHQKFTSIAKLITDKKFLLRFIDFLHKNEISFKDFFDQPFLINKAIKCMPVGLFLLQSVRSANLLGLFNRNQQVYLTFKRGYSVKMRSAVVREFGGPEKIEVTRMPMPELSDGQVRMCWITVISFLFRS